MVFTLWRIALFLKAILAPSDELLASVTIDLADTLPIFVRDNMPRREATVARADTFIVVA